MNPRVTQVKPGNDFTLRLVFTNGESGVFDMKPYLSIGVFKELADRSKFNSVRPFLGSIAWAGGQDLCADTLYEGCSRDPARKRISRRKVNRPGFLRVRLTRH